MFVESRRVLTAIADGAGAGLVEEVKASLYTTAYIRTKIY